MKSHVAMTFVALALLIGGVCTAEANRSQIRHCADDYRRFCHQWGLETRGLENCMRRHGDRLTDACIAQLVRMGEVTQAEVNRRRAALGR